MRGVIAGFTCSRNVVCCTGYEFFRYGCVRYIYKYLENWKLKRQGSVLVLYLNMILT